MREKRARSALTSHKKAACTGPVFILTVAVLLIAAPDVNAGSDPAGAPIHPDAARIRLDGHRDGPGVRAVRRFAKCLEREDKACIRDVLHGGELVVRRAREALDDGSIPVERPGLVERFRRLAAERGDGFEREVLARPLRECETSLASAMKGRCDDMGWVDAPPLPFAGAPSSYEELLKELWSDLVPDSGARRARRLICGASWTRDGVVAEEALVVLSGSGDESRLLDFRCRRVERDGDEWVGAEAVSDRPKWPPDDPEDRGALIALQRGARCLNRGGACVERLAPLPGMLVRHLMDRLPQVSSDRRRSLLDDARRAAMSGASRSEMVLDVAGRRCRRLQRLQDPTICIATGHERGAPALCGIEGVSESEASQARAIAALLWGQVLEKEITTSTVTCPTRGRPIEFQVAWTKGEDGEPVLLDLVCR